MASVRISPEKATHRTWSFRGRTGEAEISLKLAGVWDATLNGVAFRGPSPIGLNVRAAIARNCTKPARCKIEKHDLARPPPKRGADARNLRRSSEFYRFRTLPLDWCRQRKYARTAIPANPIRAWGLNGLPSPPAQPAALAALPTSGPAMLAHLRKSTKTYADGDRRLSPGAQSQLMMPSARPGRRSELISANGLARTVRAGRRQERTESDGRLGTGLPKVGR